MTRHPVDTAALRVIKRAKAEANMRLDLARKYESNGSGWEARNHAEYQIKKYDEMIQAVEGLPDDI